MTTRKRASFPVGTLLALSVGLLSMAATALPGCGSSKPAPRAVSASEVVKELPDVPPSLRGTIAAVAEFQGVDPVLVSGYGLVVGLKGTGGLDLDERIAVTMEREMARMGVSSSVSDASALSGKTPRALLRDPNTAVVMVQAAIAPGSPEGSRFDVFVRALNASSLDGGTLWTTTLRIGEAQAFGGKQAQDIAIARGPIFINPFARVSTGDQSVSRQAGRVLDGGQVTDPFKIEITLFNDSHALARSIVSSINTRFPPPLSGGDTARGRKATSIELVVPDDYRHEPAAFLQLVRHLRTDPRNGEEAARQYVEALKTDPASAIDLAWNLEAVGRKSIPFLRTLYDYPDLMPRLAALRTGARLDDAVAADHLSELALTGPISIRADAIALLGRLDGGPKVDETLRSLLDERDLPLRISAYEALAARAERAQEARLARLSNSRSNPASPKLSPTYIQELAKISLPQGMLQGISRRPIAGRFFLDVVGGGDSMVYITQQGTPRIVLFGDDLAVLRPLTVSAWDDSLMISAESTDSELRVYYKAGPNRRATTQTVPANLPDLVDFLARSSSPSDPRPGLGLSYSEIVGVLHEISKAGGLAAGFATETDRLKAQLLTAIEPIAVRERPETSSDREIVIFRAPQTTAPTMDSTPKPDSVDKPSIVPIVPPTKNPK